MLRSMSTAVSALNLHQSYLDVVANNLANANTVAYKSSSVIFHQQFAQLVSAGASSSASLGGVNATQIGLGAKMGSIKSDFSQGILQNSGSSLDLAIEGDGFFVYDNDDAYLYSREGSLSMDSEGVLVNSSSGLKIQGWLVDANGNVNSNLPPTDIQITTDSAKAQATANVVLGGNLNSTTATGDTVETTMAVYDSLGVMQTVTVEFTRTAANTWDWDVTSPASAAGDGTMTFTDGQDPAIVIDHAVSIAGSAGAQATTTMAVDMSNLTMLSMDDSVSITSQDGLTSGTVTDLYISPNSGDVYLVYSNGIKEHVAQLALARFTNPSGLTNAGNSCYEEGLNSGSAQIGTADTGGRGTISSGYLEASNVDMAQEFTNMILAQRGFQASSRVITTSDEILQELVNLKR